MLLKKFHDCRNVTHITHQLLIIKQLINQSFDYYLHITGLKIIFRWCLVQDLNIHSGMLTGSIPQTNYWYVCVLTVLTMYLRIDRNFCSVHEEITSIRLYTLGYARVCTTWLRLFQMNQTNNFDQSLLINSNFFCYDIEKCIYFFKIRQIIGNKFK